MTVSYRGGAYAGWQVQPDEPTVQGTLQETLGRVGNQAVKVTGASRTDAGVHAAGQVCHFDAPKPWTPDKWQRSLNRLLPEDIRVVDCSRASDDFHARFDARLKTYRYHVDPSPIASPFLAPFTWHRPDLVRVEEMCEAAALLEGAFDQRVFAAQPEGERHIRAVDGVSVDVGRVVTLTFVGRSFMRHAVRGMVGSLLEIGCGRRTSDELAAMTGGEPDHPPMVKAPPHGLCLLRVDY